MRWVGKSNLTSETCCASSWIAGSSPAMTRCAIALKRRLLLLPDERAVAQLAHRLVQFGLRVHHDRPVPGDRLLDRLARHQQEADALLAGLHRDLVAAVEHDQRAVAGLLAELDLLAVDLLLGQDAERRRRGNERARAREDVGEGMAVDLDLEGLALAGRYRDVEITWIGCDTLDRTGLAPKVADH